MRYVNHFLNLSCSGDVLNACNPINEPAKEISESMGIIRVMKPIILADRNKPWIVVDLCAGNALTSVLAVHLFPRVKGLAIDWKPRTRHYEHVKRFYYAPKNIFDESFMDLVCTPNDVYEYIFISVHPCKYLARRVVELYNASPDAKHLILMPCCEGMVSSDKKYPTILKEKLGGYLLWSYYLSELCGGTFIQDNNILSPCNGIVVAHK